MRQCISFLFVPPRSLSLSPGLPLCPLFLPVPTPNPSASLCLHPSLYIYLYLSPSLPLCRPPSPRLSLLFAPSSVAPPRTKPPTPYTPLTPSHLPHLPHLPRHQSPQCEPGRKGSSRCESRVRARRCGAGWDLQGHVEVRGRCVSRDQRQAHYGDAKARQRSDALLGCFERMQRVGAVGDARRRQETVLA